MASPEGGGRQREPAWHRRDRRRRAGHRLLAQVSAACVSLASHHGSAPPEILRPLLNTLSKYAPRPDDVPWPYALISKGSHRSPKSVLMPNSNIDIQVVAGASVVVSTSPTSSSLVRGSMAGDSRNLDIPEVAVVSPVASTSTSVSILSGGEWRPLSFNTTSTSSTLARGILAGDFRSLPRPQWRGLFAKFAPAPSQVAAFRNMIIEKRVFVNSHVGLRVPTTPESVLLDNFSQFCQLVSGECNSWASGDFPHFRFGLNTCVGRVLNDLLEIRLALLNN
jgi:hypothetical protein